MLQANVGKGERNRQGDVLEIQKLLNLNVKNVPGMQSVVENSDWDWRMEQALIAFQRAKVRGISQRSLGRVKPGDETFVALLLNADSTTNRPPNLRESADSIKQRVQQSEFVGGANVVGAWTVEGPSPRELTDAEIPKGGNREIRWELPERGLGFVTYNRNDTKKDYPNGKRMPDQVGTRQTIDRIRTIAREWFRYRPSRPLQIGDISLPGGVNTPDHDTHQNGRNIDIRPIRNDSKWGPGANLTFNSSSYDLENTRALLQIILRLYPGTSFIFNDPKIYRAPEFSRVVRHDSQGIHDNHIHVMLP